MEIHRINYHVKPHRHNFLEFYYVMEGNGLEISNGQEYNLEPGTFRIILPYHIHEMKSRPGEDMITYNCSVGMEVLFEVSKSFSGLHQLLQDDGKHPFILYLKDQENQAIKRQLDEMYHEFIHEQLWRELRFKALFTNLLIMFDRIRRLNRDTDKIAPTNSDYPIWEIVHFVYMNYKDDLKLEELSKQFHLSKSYLSTLFKQHIGQNFQPLLQQIRIQHACGLLSSSDMLVTDVAFEVGFQSYEAFWRVFSKVKGVSPTVYRKRHTILNSKR